MDQDAGRGEKKLAKPNPAADTADTGPPPRGETVPQKTQPAEEWGERQDTGKTIHKGGKESGQNPAGSEEKP